MTKFEFKAIIIKHILSYNVLISTVIQTASKLWRKRAKKIRIK